MKYFNHDITWDTDLSKLNTIAKVFDKYGIKEIYGVTPLGKHTYPDEHIMDLEYIDEKIGHKMLTDNVIEWLKGKEIALHGWKHTNMNWYSGETFEREVIEYRKWLEDKLETKIEYFIPPFNVLSQEYENKIVNMGMYVVADKASDLEYHIEKDLDMENDRCFYHWWSLDINKLDKYLEKRIK